MGADKAFLTWKGEPLWHHQWETLRETSPRRMYLSCSATAASRFPAGDVVPDAVEDAGPMAGISAVLERLAEPLLLVLAVDVPLVTPAVL